MIVDVRIGKGAAPDTGGGDRARASIADSLSRLQRGGVRHAVDAKLASVPPEGPAGPRPA